MRTYWHTNNLWYREEVGRYAPFPSVNFAGEMRERWEKIQEFQRECPFFSEPSRMDLETTVNIAIYGIHAPHKGCDFFVHYFSLSSLTTASAPWTVTHPCL